MEIVQGNLFDIPSYAGDDPGKEWCDTLLLGDGPVKLEHIISMGHVSPPGFWYEQETDEWVALLTGSASVEFEDGKMVHMRAGDYIMLPSGTRHRVAYTCKTTPCVWLALHSKSGNR